MAPNTTAPTGAASAPTPPLARMKWDDLDGIRTLLFVLYKRYTYWNATQYALIINAICQRRMPAMGLPNGIDNHRIGAEWRARKNASVRHKWIVVRSRGNEAEARQRDFWEAIVRIVAPQVELTLREEVEEEQDDDGSDVEEDGGGDDELTAEEAARETREFRRKFERMQGTGEDEDD
ncbi:uncharacterized protein RCC_08818 [Ramularia collo-cygni]|uniref:Uncharacterized protein n=1 Tax=Ramularia collo-cygni TaxID=112498 RepID=A0A2D3VN33_9PEZI|nr:uncharacterized protein RCC_08818 [Ramularia collo-cygni]CZT23108.1 uncharacterized protein RCC_08818 [Ramularia collo-cygni]